MGNQRNYLVPGGFSTYLYEDHPLFSTITYNGLKAKVIRLVTDADGGHAGLPPYSNTSDIYLRCDKYGNVVQAKVYLDRMHSLDFDWGHEHRNKGIGGDVQIFPKGVVHVQCYSKSGLRFSNRARYMTDTEIRKYGEILRHFCPNVKFRP